MRKKTILDMDWLQARTAIEPDGCWRWTKSIMSHGYGQAMVNGQHTTAHRAAYYIKHGEWPNIARHTCDHRYCANPDHIINGTIADNSRDYAERGRGHKGEDHERAKLSDRDVIVIRRAISLGFRNADIAKKYNVVPSTISHIRTGARRRTR
jgi:hypothetical protein